MCPCQICGTQSGTGTGFLRVFGFPPVSNIPSLFHTHLHLHVTEVFLNLTEVFLTLAEVFPCFFLSCKANARVKLAKTGHGPHSTTLVCICVVRLLFVLFYVLFVCKCVLPPGDNPIAVNIYIYIYIYIYILSRPP